MADSNKNHEDVEDGSVDGVWNQDDFAVVDEVGEVDEYDIVDQIGEVDQVSENHDFNTDHSSEQHSGESQGDNSALDEPSFQSLGKCRSQETSAGESLVGRVKLLIQPLLLDDLNNSNIKSIMEKATFSSCFTGYNGVWKYGSLEIELEGMAEVTEIKQLVSSCRLPGGRTLSAEIMSETPCKCPDPELSIIKVYKNQEFCSDMEERRHVIARNLPPDVTVEMLKVLFPYVQKIQLHQREDSSNSRCATLEMSSGGDADALIQYHSQFRLVIGGRVISLKVKPEKSPDVTRLAGSSGKESVNKGNPCHLKERLLPESVRKDGQAKWPVQLEPVSDDSMSESSGLSFISCESLCKFDNNVCNSEENFSLGSSLPDVELGDSRECEQNNDSPLELNYKSFSDDRNDFRKSKHHKSDCNMSSGSKEDLPHIMKRRKRFKTHFSRMQRKTFLRHRRILNERKKRRNYYNVCNRQRRWKKRQTAFEGKNQYYCPGLMDEAMSVVELDWSSPHIDILQEESKQTSGHDFLRKRTTCRPVENSSVCNGVRTAESDDLQFDHKQSFRGDDYSMRSSLKDLEVPMHENLGQSRDLTKGDHYRNFPEDYWLTGPRLKNVNSYEGNSHRNRHTNESFVDDFTYDLDMTSSGLEPNRSAGLNDDNLSMGFYSEYGRNDMMPYGYSDEENYYYDDRNYYSDASDGYDVKSWRRDTGSTVCRYPEDEPLPSRTDAVGGEIGKFGRLGDADGCLSDMSEVQDAVGPRSRDFPAIHRPSSGAAKFSRHKSRDDRSCRRMSAKHPRDESFGLSGEWCLRNRRNRVSVDSRQGSSQKSARSWVNKLTRTMEGHIIRDSCHGKHYSERSPQSQRRDRIFLKSRPCKLDILPSNRSLSKEKEILTPDRPKTSTFDDGTVVENGNFSPWANRHYDSISEENYHLHKEDLQSNLYLYSRYKSPGRCGHRKGNVHLDGNRRRDELEKYSVDERNCSRSVPSRGSCHKSYSSECLMFDDSHDCRSESDENQYRTKEVFQTQEIGTYDIQKLSSFDNVLGSETGSCHNRYPPSYSSRSTKFIHDKDLRKYSSSDCALTGSPKETRHCTNLTRETKHRQVSNKSHDTNAGTGTSRESLPGGSLEQHYAKQSELGHFIPGCRQPKASTLYNDNDHHHDIDYRLLSSDHSCAIKSLDTFYEPIDSEGSKCNADHAYSRFKGQGPLHATKSSVQGTSSSYLPSSVFYGSTKFSAHQGGLARNGSDSQSYACFSNGQLGSNICETAPRIIQPENHARNAKIPDMNLYGHQPMKVTTVTSNLFGDNKICDVPESRVSAEIPTCRPIVQKSDAPVNNCSHIMSSPGRHLCDENISELYLANTTVQYLTKCRSKEPDHKKIHQIQDNRVAEKLHQQQNTESNSDSDYKPPKRIGNPLPNWIAKKFHRQKICKHSLRSRDQNQNSSDDVSDVRKLLINQLQSLEQGAEADPRVIASIAQQLKKLCRSDKLYVKSRSKVGQTENCGSLTQIFPCQPHLSGWISKRSSDDSCNQRILSSSDHFSKNCSQHIPRTCQSDKNCNIFMQQEISANTKEFVSVRSHSFKTMDTGSVKGQQNSTVNPSLTESVFVNKDSDHTANNTGSFPTHLQAHCPVYQTISQHRVSDNAWPK